MATLQAELARAEAERDAARAEAQALRAQLLEAEALADRDPLVPVLNRRAFVRELGRAAAFCARYEASAALVYIDLDDFKAVNDRHGHAAGDAVLQAVGRTLLAHVRVSDQVARLGGDEFAVLLAQADRAAGVQKAEALRVELARSPVIFEGRGVPVSASAGVRAWIPGLEAERWLAEADAAMFVRKGEAGARR